jgi:hypothetical protein
MTDPTSELLAVADGMTAQVIGDIGETDADPPTIFWKHSRKDTR